MVSFEGSDEEELSPTEAFAILGNEIRLATLQALWESPEPAVSYAELRRRVGEDGGGNFNYHLGKLEGHFVRKTDDGYALRYAGEQVVRSVVAGTLTADPTIEPTRLDEQCPYCDSILELFYEDELLTVRCTGCDGVIRGDFPEGTLMHYGFPPGGLEGRTLEEVFDAAHNLYDAKITPMMRGVCPECGGRTDVEHDICEDHAFEEDGLCSTCDSRFKVWSEYVCERCKYTRKSAMWFEALTHPAVISFYHEQAGLDEPVPFRKITADNASLVKDITETVISVDPPRFEVSVPVGGETLVVDLDEALNVTDVSRTDESDSRLN